MLPYWFIAKVPLVGQPCLELCSAYFVFLIVTANILVVMTSLSQWSSLRTVREELRSTGRKLRHTEKRWWSVHHVYQQSYAHRIDLRFPVVVLQTDSAIRQPCWLPRRRASARAKRRWGCVDLTWSAPTRIGWAQARSTNLYSMSTWGVAVARFLVMCISFRAPRCVVSSRWGDQQRYQNRFPGSDIVFMDKYLFIACHASYQLTFPDSRRNRFCTTSANE